MSTATERVMHEESRGTLLEDGRFEALLHQLVNSEHDKGILSVYLDIDPAIAGRQRYQAALMDLWKPLRARPHDAWMRGRLEYEIEGITGEVRRWEQAPGRSVAMFFSGPAGLRAVVPLHFPVRPVARFEARPVLAPLIAALDEHRRYCVVIFDKERARLVTVFLGQVEDETVLQSDIIGRTAVGGFSQSNYARHREHQLHEHARRTVEHLWAIDRTRPIHALVLGGPDEALAVLRRALPPTLARAVAGTVAVEMFAITPDVVHRVTALETSTRETEDAQLVAELVAATGQAGRAAVGWADALQALGEGRVHMLVLPPGITRAGIYCAEGHFISVGEMKFCPVCGGQLQASDDITETAVRVAMLTDAAVHFLAPAAGDTLAQRGIGAFLRY